MRADEEDDKRVAPGDCATDENGYILGDIVLVRYRQDFTTITREQVDFVAVSPVQIISAYEANEGSQRQLADRFKVNLSFVRNLLRNY